MLQATREKDGWARVETSSELECQSHATADETNLSQPNGIVSTLTPKKEEKDEAAEEYIDVVAPTRLLEGFVLPVEKDGEGVGYCQVSIVRMKRVLRVFVDSLCADSCECEF